MPDIFFTTHTYKVEVELFLNRDHIKMDENALKKRQQKESRSKKGKRKTKTATQHLEEDDVGPSPDTTNTTTADSVASLHMPYAYFKLRILDAETHKPLFLNKGSKGGLNPLASGHQGALTLCRDGSISATWKAKFSGSSHNMSTEEFTPTEDQKKYKRSFLNGFKPHVFELRIFLSQTATPNATDLPHDNELHEIARLISRKEAGFNVQIRVNHSRTGSKSTKSDTTSGNESNTSTKKRKRSDSPKKSAFIHVYGEQGELQRRGRLNKRLKKMDPPPSENDDEYHEGMKDKLFDFFLCPTNAGERKSTAKKQQHASTDYLETEFFFPPSSNQPSPQSSESSKKKKKGDKILDQWASSLPTNYYQDLLSL